MLTLREILRRTQTGDGEAQINEASNELPALLVLKRGAIRTLSDGRKIAEYHHADSGFTLIYPMMFTMEKRR